MIDNKENANNSEQANSDKVNKIVAKKKVGSSFNEIYSREVNCELTDDNLILIAEDILHYEQLNENEDKFDILLTVNKKPIYWLKGRFGDKKPKDIIDIRDIFGLFIMYLK